LAIQRAQWYAPGGLKCTSALPVICYAICPVEYNEDQLDKFQVVLTWLSFGGQQVMENSHNTTHSASDLMMMMMNTTGSLLKPLKLIIWQVRLTHCTGWLLWHSHHWLKVCLIHKWPLFLKTTEYANLWSRRFKKPIKCGSWHSFQHMMSTGEEEKTRLCDVRVNCACWNDCLLTYLLVKRLLDDSYCASMDARICTCCVKTQTGQVFRDTLPLLQCFNYCIFY